MILTFIPDLLLQSKICGLVSRTGRQCRNVSSVKELTQTASENRATLVILDLENAAQDMVNVVKELVSVDAKVIGFYSHVHPEIAKSCLEAGCFNVLTRSQLDRQLPAVVEEAHAS